MGALARARAQLERAVTAPVDGASLAALRVAYGAIMALVVARFFAHGWIDELYVRPSFHFTYYGFEWVRPWHHYEIAGRHLPEWCMHLHFALLGAAGLFVALGLWYRVAIAAVVVLFGYVELLDATNYLNHYYALTIVGALLCFLPAARTGSLDAWLVDHRVPRRGTPPAGATVARGAVWILRLQIGLVYFFAGLAKVNGEWLFRAEPLRTWLAARTDAPVIGPLLGLEATAYGGSWAACLFDLSIPFLLASRRTRAPAYVLVVLFHLCTAMLFQIGVFPWVMIALTTIFFEPSWPRRLFGRREACLRADVPPRPRRMAPAVAVALAAHFVIQLVLPLRHHLYSGDVLWNEMGMRYAWHVMIADRSGLAELWAMDEDGHRWVVDPRETLSPPQERAMATQPDLLLQYAHRVHDDFARQGRSVEVHADVWVSLDGRPSRRLVDPAVDLAAEEDGLGGFSWVIAD